MPQQFATVQRDAGAAYEALSQIERFAEPRLTQSVEAYREAIGALDRGVHPQLWAHIGLDFARALHALGMESGIDRWLSEAQIVQQAALEALRTLGETALVKFAEDDLAERDQQVERSRRAGATGRR